ncbi:MAG: malectin domain-containing carbohydrate-binding protein [Bryobacteraceae bacterium]
MKQLEALGEEREQAVLAELNHVLESAAFRTSRRCRDFLTYIVKHTMSGPQVTLKERSIGVDLFQLPPDFDTGQHTIVRVTASEVRKKLAQYYLAENGTVHPVRIDLPPGSYSAEFKWAALPAETHVPPAAEPAPVADMPSPDLPAKADIPRKVSRWRGQRVLFSALAVLVLIGTILLWRSHRTTAPPALPKPTREAESVATSLPTGPSVRLIVGSKGSYIDRSGRLWGPDRFFSGGSVVVRPSEKIYRTLDPDIYRHVRQGDFQYDIPLKTGVYELHLFFAETGLSDFISAESSGEGQRLFRVSANGKLILDVFDVVADAAGTNIADERVFRNISPAADGLLHLSFTSIRSTAILSGIDAVPVSPGTTRPLRIRAGWPSSWQDSAGEQWDADGYFLGGNALVRTTNPVRESDAMPLDAALYSSERWGHFSYALPLPEGRYKVTLKFSEGHYGRHNTGVGGLGSRVFDVYCNGVALLRNFDIYKEAGGEGRPLDRTFSGIRPDAQGKINLSFVPVKGMACVNGIEVEEEPK